MPSALERGRPIRFRPSSPGSINKLPECAGIYYIHDAEGNIAYVGQAVNLRRRVKQHKKVGKIPEGGYVDCFRAKDGIAYDELDATERDKINKYNPPLNQRDGGGGRKSPKLKRHASEALAGMGTDVPEQAPKSKRSFLYRLLGYERIDRTGEVHYTKEPKAILFMMIELIVKLLLIVNTLLAALGCYLRYTREMAFSQYGLIAMTVVPVACFILFHYIRRNKGFAAMVFISVAASVILYLSSYPIPFELPF